MVASSWRPLAYAGGHQTVEGWLAPCLARSGAGTRACAWPAPWWRSAPVGSTRSLPGSSWPPRSPRQARSPTGSPPEPAAVARLSSVTSWLTGDLGACRRAAVTAVSDTGEPTAWDPLAYTWLGASTYWLGSSKRKAWSDWRSPSSGFVPPGPSSARPRPQCRSGRCATSGGGATAVACLGMLGLVHVLEQDFDTAQRVRRCRPLAVRAVGSGGVLGQHRCAHRRRDPADARGAYRGGPYGARPGLRDRRGGERARRDDACPGGPRARRPSVW